MEEAPNMRKALWFIPVLFLLLAIVTPCARADSVTFTCTAMCLAPVPTAPDVTFPSPTLDITFDSQTLDLTLSSEDVDTDAFTWFTSNNQFIISDNNVLGFMGTSGVADNSEEVEDEGGALLFTPATASTPEPGTVTLMLVGTGLVLVMRKRIGLCHSQGT
jgi:hypothetical protein